MNKVYLILILIVTVFTGCATPQKPMYYWGSYSSSLYAYKKTPGDETLKAHKEVLLNIIEESQKQNIRVPPGVYCEYGYIMLQEGKKKEALRYFELEEQTYPESKVFIERLKSLAKDKE